MKSETSRSLAQVFWASVDRSDECWTWTGSLSYTGYGRLRAHGHTFMAHRIAYELATGADPSGLVVCHRCDNPPCVRPDHLFLGTAADNQRDMTDKGRGRLGERNGRAKITREMAEAIRAEYAATRPSQHSLAYRYGLSQSHVSAIIRGSNWRD